MEDKIVFDFTELDFQNISYDFKQLYIQHASRAKRKQYFIDKINDEKVQVTITNSDHNEYTCIYRYLEKETIIRMIEYGQPLHLDGIYVKDFNIEEINDIQNHPLKDFSAQCSFWDGTTSFNYSSFVDGIISFKMAQFGDGDLSFVGTQFGDGDMFFNDTQMGFGNIFFIYAHFGIGNIYFNGAHFSFGDVSFSGTNFNKGSIYFWNTQFDVENVSFNEAQFSGSDISFDGAYFGDSKVNFSPKKIDVEKISFHDCKANYVLIKNVIFKNYVDLRFKKIYELIIEECKIEKVLQCDTVNIAKLSLLNTINLGQIYIHWDNIQSGKQNAIDNGFTGLGTKQRPFTHKEMSDQFRMLKENFHNIGYYDDEDKAYFAYMRHKRLALKEKTDEDNKEVSKATKGEKLKATLKNRSQRAFYWLFEKIGGFGTKPLNILGWAAGFVVGFGIIQAFFMQSDSFWLKLLKGCYFSTITFFTIGYGDVLPANGWSAVFSGAEGFVGVVTMSYFTVALVRKLLR